MYQIENEELTVKVSPLGAELQSIYDKRMDKHINPPIKYIIKLKK